MRPGRRAPEPVASRAGCRCERLILRDTSANSPQHDFTNTARGTDDNTNTAAMEAIDTSSMTAATPVAGTERLRAKQPLDVRTATKGLFALSGTGNDAALKALFDDCVLIDHTAQGLDDCQPVPADLIRDEDGATALLPACEGGHIECVKLLLTHGCPPGKPNRIGRTPVMTVCFGGQTDCLALLLEARASPYEGLMTDPGSGAEGGATPIVMAIDHLGRSAEDACLLLTPHSSPPTPHSSLFTPHSSLTSHPSPLTPHSSLLTPHSALLTPHSSLLTTGRPMRPAFASCYAPTSGCARR